MWRALYFVKGNTARGNEHRARCLRVVRQVRASEGSDVNSIPSIDPMIPHCHSSTPRVVRRGCRQVREGGTKMSKKAYPAHPEVPISKAVRAGDFVYTSAYGPWTFD